MTTVNLETLLLAVDRVLTANWLGALDRSGSLNVNPPKEARDDPAIMLDDTLIQCDINVELWETALHATMRDITSHTYPHYSTIQRFFNYTLNRHRYTDFGLVSAVMARLRFTYPPHFSNMTEFYKHILMDKYGVIYGETVEDEEFFWVIVDLVIGCGKDAAVAFDQHPPKSEDISDKVKDTLLHLSQKTKPKSVTFFKDLSLEEQRKRSTICLQFLCEFLIDDFTIWFKKYPKNINLKKRSLLAQLIWPDAANEGYMNKNVQRIISMQDASFSNPDYETSFSERLFHITAELIRACDHREHSKIAYPFFGPHTKNFARTFSLYLIERQGAEASFNYVQGLQPPWLRLLTLCEVISNLAGFQCEPELLSAVTIMEHLEWVFKMGRAQTRRISTKTRPAADPEIIAKFSKLKSVNACFRSGLSRLQTACHDDNIEAVRALLTFPSLDLNQTDPSGWTALHKAAHRGSLNCVNEMLDYLPPVDSVQRRVDTRARGPGNYTALMCAVEAGHEEICAALLKHTGSVLLEDINDDSKTALDLCTNADIFRILKNYRDRKVETIYSRKELYLNTGNLPLLAQFSTALVQSYFSVHATWTVYHEMKRIAKVNAQPSYSSAGKAVFEYVRYHRDFRGNLPKIRIMAGKMRKIKELDFSSQILVRIVSLNKP